VIFLENFQPHETLVQIRKMHLNFLQFAALLKFYSNNNTDCRENHLDPLQQFTNIDYLHQFVIGDCGESIDPDWPIYFSPDCLKSKCCQFLQDIDRFDATTVSLVNKFIDFSIWKFTNFRNFQIERRQISWHAPKLLILPPVYETLFRKFYQKPCENCSAAAGELSKNPRNWPSDPLLCLLCGKMVCGGGECCQKSVDLGRHFYWN